MIGNEQLNIPFTLKNYDWDHREQIGQSSTGAVYKVKVLNSKTHQYVAIRKFSLPKSPIVYEMFYKEVQKLKEIKSNFMVDYIDSQLSQRGGYIVMELCECDLATYLSQYQWKMPNKVAQTVISHIVEALTVLKKNNYNCVFLNPKNFLIKDRFVKYSPIGIGKYEINFKESSITSLPLYMAPEIILNENLIEQHNNAKAAVWSIGVIAYQLVVGSLPFSYHSWESYKAVIMQQKVNFPDKIEISEVIKDFIKKCLVKEENERSDLMAISHHQMIFKNKKPIPKRYTPSIARIWKKLKINRQKIQNSILQQLKSEEEKQPFALTLEMFESLCKKQIPQMTSKDITQVFRQYDVNNNNQLDVNELVTIFQIFKIHNENVYVFMRDLAENMKKKNIDVYKISENFDSDKNKMIDYNQIKSLILSVLPNSSYSMINKVWDHLEEIHGGEVTTSNMLQELLRYLPSQQSEVKQRAHLALNELKKGLLEHKIQLPNIFEYFDYNNDKKMSLTQFEALFNSIVGFERHQEISIVFNLVDEDRSGYISPNQLKLLWKNSN